MKYQHQQAKLTSLPTLSSLAWRFRFSSSCRNGVGSAWYCLGKVEVLVGGEHSMVGVLVVVGGHSKARGGNPMGMGHSDNSQCSGAVTEKLNFEKYSKRCS